MMICKTIKEHNGFEQKVTPLLMGMGAYMDWGHDLMFDQLYYDLRALT